MKVTFDINEEIVECLREEADSRGETMSALVESVLRMALSAGKTRLYGKGQPVEFSADDPLPPLPTWKSGGFLVDISNREELYRVLDDAEDSKLRMLYGYRPLDESDEKE